MLKEIYRKIRSKSSCFKLTFGMKPKHKQNKLFMSWVILNELHLFELNKRVHLFVLALLTIASRITQIMSMQPRCK